MASHLKTASAPGAVLLSETAHARLKDAFRVEPTPAVDLNGIGVLAVRLLHHRVGAAVAAA